MTPFEERQSARERDGQRIYESLANMKGVSPEMKFMAGVVVGNFVQAFGFLDQMTEHLHEANQLLALAKPVASPDDEMLRAIDIIEQDAVQDRKTANLRFETLERQNQALTTELKILAARTVLRPNTGSHE